MDDPTYHNECRRFGEDTDPVTHVKEHLTSGYTVSVESDTRTPDGSEVMTLIVYGKREVFTTSLASCHDEHVKAHPEIYAKYKAAAAVVSPWYVIDLGNNAHFGTCNRLSDAFRGMKDPGQLYAVLTKGGARLKITWQGADVAYIKADDGYAWEPLIMASSKSLCDNVADELLKRQR